MSPTPNTSPAPAADAVDRNLQLRDEVRQLAAQYKDARRLTAEVSRLLFYRYDEAPNANRIYNLTRRGSLTTISEEVDAFWQRLRTQTQASIACPGLVPELAVTMGKFLSGLIASIEQRLRVELAVQQTAAVARVHEAELALQQEQEAGAVAVATARDVLAAAQERLTQRESALAGVQQQLIKENAAVEYLRAEVSAWQTRAASAQEQATETQALFSRELASLREALAAAEARASGAEDNALQRIEAERAGQRRQIDRMAKLEKALEVQQTRSHSLAQQVLQLTEENGVLTGRLQGLQEERKRLADLLKKQESQAVGPSRKPARKRQPKVAIPGHSV